MKPERRSARTFAALVIALVLSQGAMMSARAENRVSVSVVGGERSAFASAIVFETVRGEQGAVLQFGVATVVVDDSSGTNAGWSVTIHLDGVDDAHRVAIAAVDRPIHLAGQAITSDGGPALPGIVPNGTLDRPRTVLVAEPGHGKGRYEQRITIVRRTPSVSSGEAASDLSLAVTITPRGATP